MGDRYYPLLLRDPVTGIEEVVAELPSVTTIEQMRAKPGLMYWGYGIGKAGKNLNDEMQQAQDRGSDVHEIIPVLALEGHEDFKLELYPEDLHGWITGMLKWWQLHLPITIQCEFAICSLLNRYAGRVDFFASMGGSYTLVDFKTVDSAEKFIKYPTGYTSHKSQLVAYAYALREFGRRVDRIMLVRLSPDGNFHEYEIPKRQWDDLFQSFMRMYDEFHFERSLNGAH